LSVIFRYQVCHDAVELLCTIDGQDVSYDLLPYLVVVNGDQAGVAVAKVIMEHSPGELHILMNTIRTGIYMCVCVCVFVWNIRIGYKVL